MVVRKPFIVVEGLDGSGKTAVCQRISEQIKCQQYKTPPYLFDSIRGVIDSAADAGTRFFFYLSSILYASSEIKAIINTTSVVCDRYLHSTLSYHYALNPRLPRLDLSGLDILKPDIVFYLTVPYEERVRRIARRENRTLEDVAQGKYDADGFLTRVESEFAKFKEMVRIDAVNLSLDELVSVILHKVSNIE
jgi:thymidylate kinase